MKTDDKKIYLVDSGLSFNLPFPLTLRPQRGIELYITCDFSSRVSDSTPPFRVRHSIDWTLIMAMSLKGIFLYVVGTAPGREMGCASQHSLPSC